MQLDEYQREAVRTRLRPHGEPGQHLVVSLLGLSGEAGELISEYKKYLRDGEQYEPLKERVAEELGDVLWYLASVADEFGLSLDAVAWGNLEKIRDRWAGDAAKGMPRFDADFPAAERLPQRLQVTFEDSKENGIHRTQMRIEGTELGDPLTDNNYEEDGYRFHDVFHWACAVTLGWSPVLRKLLRRKRKSDRRADEVEDGARAAAIEEGISALVFSYAADRAFLSGVHKVDSGLLRTIKGMTRHLEVSACSPGDWERTILVTFDVWRSLNRRDGGTLIVDLAGRTVAVSA